MRFLLHCAVSLVICGVLPAAAHHTAAHGGAIQTAFSPLASQLRPPTTFVDVSATYDRLGGDLGAVATYQIAGEYAVTPRVSIGGRVPVVSVWEDFLPQTTELGDVALSIKGTAGAWPAAQRALNLGAEFTVPTGNEAAGTGSGAIAFAPYATLIKRWRPLTLLLSAGSTVACTAPLRPSLEYAAAMIVPLWTRRVPIDGVLTLQGSTTPARDTFADWSTKLYAKPALTLHLRPTLLTTLGAKISVVDSLRVKPGIALSRLSTAPLSDVTVGGFVSLNYAF